MDTRIATIFFYSELLILCSSILNSYAIDTIAVNRSLRDGETVISAGERFELGFFTPAGRSSNDRYVGIWYYNLNPRTVVWVANREMPLLDTSGYFAVDDGNLKVLDQSGKLYWWTDLQTPSDSRYRLYWEAKLMDSGNLVLRNQLARNIWESIEYPTDTFLSGMKMDLNLTLTSWTSQDDPAPGKFTFKLDQEGKNQFTIRNGYRPHWRNGVSGEFFRSEEIPSEFTYFLSNFNISFIPNISEGHVFLSEYNNTRVVMNFNGEIQYWNLHEYQNAWSLDWWEPKDRCSILNVCGSFGSCNSNNKLLCKCLPGFKPKLPKNWNKGDFYDGCTRNSTCDKDDIFLNLKMMKVENTDSKIDVKNKIECRDQCLSNYQCQAYSYSEAKNILRRDKPIGPTCWLWTEELNNLQEEYLYRGHDLFVRVSSSDIESTVRNCEACGTNAIPYPLSTGLNCGEPMYFSFYCNKSAGKLSFKAPTGTYNVANINPTTRTFVIQAKQVDNCKVRDGTVLRLNQSLQLPFILNNVSSCGAEVEFSSDTLSENVNEIEISWQPPLEPSCTSSADCKDWPYSTCNLTDGMQRCHCNANFRWDGLALNCTPEENYHESFGESSTRKTPLFFIIGVTVASIIVLLCVIACICIYRRKMAERQESRKNIERDAGLLYGTEKRVKDMIESQDFKEEDKKGIDVPFFYLNSILAATDNFSDINMLGRGGFGPVYKGTFPGGQEIAIKRLSSVSGQGMEEFKNEVVLIARLQHRNLVKLLGYCIQGDENILLYEYMPNKSLDSFIFDQKLSILLDWEMRFDIILGVARGLLYLHQDSRLRIIHRDLKTSNILLDAEMNPKISDFGLAKIFEGKQTEGSTSRVIGTYGYMSPEYALDGLFSVKSDVFSFGVVVLEILSGRRSTGVFKTGQALNLLGYAWRLWREDKAHDFMDETLSGSCKRDEFLKCLHIALLCIQEDPAERPTMSNVVVMLSSIETATFPTPKQPAFVDRRDFSSTASSSSSKQEIITKWTTTR